MKVGLGLTVLAAAFALSACGSSGAKITTKEQAAQAMYGAGNAAETAQQSMMRQLISGATTVDVTVSCKKGGSITLHASADSTDTTGTATITYEFSGCVSGSYTDPKTNKAEDVKVDGNLSFALGGTTDSFNLTFNGHLDFSGGIDDSMDITNVSYTFASDGTNVSIALTGDIKTSTQSFHFDGSETFTASATGTISAAP